MKWILIALLLLAVAFIVYAVLGRRDAAAGRETETDQRDLAPASRVVPAAGAGAPVASGDPAGAAAPVDTRSTIFDDPEPLYEPDEARPAEADTAPTASTEPEEGNMFGWGKDKDEQDQVDQTSAEGQEPRSDDYVPRRGAGIDDAEARADGGALGEDGDEVDQPRWTTSAHDPDHTVAEERSDGERTTFDEDVTTTATEDRADESHEGAFAPTGGDDVTDAPSNDQTSGDDRAEKPVEHDDEAEANAESAADPEAQAAAGSGDESAPSEGRGDGDTGVEPGEAAGDDSEAAAKGSQEAYEAGQASAGALEDHDAVEGATDGSEGEHAVDESTADNGANADEGEPADDGANAHEEEPADPAEFRQRGDWVADDESGAEVQTAQDAAELRGGPTVLPDGSVAGSDSGETGGEGHDEHEEHQEQGGGDWQHDEAAEGESASAEDESGQGWTRRVSELDEVRDGGYGVGSAATFEDRAMPLGHPIKAWEDTKTYVDESHPNYGDAEPHVWFADQEAAERAGFRRVD